MEKKTNDLRYIKTERLIRKAFYELLKEKDIKRITVRELVERAEINKTTFYSHYETLLDLIDTLEREKIAYILDNLDEVLLLYHDSDSFIDNMYENLQGCQIFEINRQGTSGYEFAERLKEVLGQQLKKRDIPVEKFTETTTILVFILHGLLGVLNTKEHNPEDLEIIKKLIKLGLKQYLPLDS